MTQYTIKATVDQKGRLVLPAEIARHFTAGQELEITLPTEPENPFLSAVGILPKLPGGNLTFIRNLREHGA
ncbi:AbrB/MazE/SpoVT family DNA-binding domain-containing protein [Deinococcus radiophilus]|uniref:AbrB/MazE/SpoVT family DNA-binding domain-containing protein n=1 Tax=Deinococcus radiophilus TaxID=32062 RepID=A0A431VQ33_9DEIO|nr:AbrB/MazE/SpoVT family DNA-binding domain-containing protein [Deinococcus radiophilus]RTR25312.1 AbrB/MazE/SpoVT family DNA-binding domain-containing protein [Deinococcus radiophilus]UFA52065.1 AbrB/MazE/SpoVT family DNA-binding domain-containing protein [Deinococcus radiophilus]